MYNQNELEINIPYEDQISFPFPDINYNEQINEEEFEFFFDIIFKNTEISISEEIEVEIENPSEDPRTCPIVFNEVNVVDDDEEDEIIENIVIEIKNKPKEKIEEKPNLIVCEKIKKNEKPSQFFIFNEGSGKVFLNKKRFIIDERDEITDVKSNNYNSDNLSYDLEKIITKKKKKRKEKPDDIRKKIKSRFHKTLKNRINDKLKKAGSKKFFDFLPQSFISNITRGINKQALEMTYKEILSTKFLNNKKVEVDSKKYEKNIKVLDYLNENEEIYKKSNFNNICSLTYKQILNEYFFSKEFEDAVEKLRKENESQNYIEQYISRSETYIEFFENEI